MTPSITREWNTWDGQHPGAMVHLPTGLCVRLTAYSGKSGKYDELSAGRAVQLHEHTSDGSYIRLRATVAGSEIELEFAKGEDHTTVMGRVRMVKAGEWALRFWLSLEVGFTEVRSGPLPVPGTNAVIDVHMPPAGREYLEVPVVTTRYRSTWCAVATSERPVFAGLYDVTETLRRELENRGYYAPHVDAEAPGWAVLRFNGQANSEFYFAVAAGSDEAGAILRTRKGLAVAESVLAEQRSSAQIGSEAFQAVRDVVSWNTIWDVENSRAMTVLTRNWLTGKFGGWGVWLNDVLFNALMAGCVGDWETARANLDAALTTLTPDGNLPCLRTSYEEWVDRSQPPNAGYVLWRLFALTGDRTLLDQYLPAVMRSHEWWFETRDGNGDGLMEFGSSPTGTGAFVHTKQAAMDEAAMDNLPAFDESEFDVEAHTLDVSEPGLNSLISLEGQCLAELLDVKGESTDARRLRDRATALNKVMSEHLWDEGRAVFAGRRWTGDFVRSLAPTSFYPLVAGAASGEQITGLVSRHLLSEDEFWGERILPASTFDDPASADNVYWRGRIWPPMLFWTWEGLRRSGRRKLADDVAERAWNFFVEGWRSSRQCRENYHRLSAEGDASPDSDDFYAWGALIPLMRLLTFADHSPWDGRVFDPTESEAGVLIEPGMQWSAERCDGGMQVSCNGVVTVKAIGVGRLAVGGHPGMLEICAHDVAAGASLVLPEIAWRDVVAYSLNHHQHKGEQTDQPFTLVLQPGPESKLVVWTRSGCIDGLTRKIGC